jgi:molecular chaperone DnaK (HSP70)
MAEYEIMITANPEGDLVLNCFEQLLEAAKQCIEDYPCFLVQSKQDQTKLRKFRSEINKKKKAIADGRKQVKEQLLETFEAQCKTIEDLLDEHQKKMGEAINAYDERNGNIKQKQYSVSLKFFDEKVIEKIKQFAIENNCELTIKE